MMVRTASDGFKARDSGPWTLDKLTYLRKYAAAFMTAMNPKRAQGKWNRLLFIDLLAGPGIDIVGAEEHRGSPLIAIETVPPFDRVFLGDIVQANVDALRHRIAPSEQGRVDLQAGDCHVRAAQIIGELSRGDLGFAFIDPEGFEVRFELFETFARRRIDLLFLCPTGIGIKRNLERFARNEGETHLDALWGNRAWRNLPIAKILAGQSVSFTEAERIDQSWVTAFCERVATLGYTHYESTPPLRNDQNVPMYHLIFFSKNQAGLSIWRGISRIEPGGQKRLWE